jgi:hypothetical protein
MIIYGMAGFAGIAGVAIFIVSEKKRKGDIAAGNVQTGIDPSQLVGADTSTGSGGYKTNRGEAHLKSDDYEQTRSVYENTQVEDKTEEPTTEEPTTEEPTTEEPTSKPGAMPKGWKPE